MVVGLDVGSDKICAVIGERNEEGLLEITGVGRRPSTGVKKGAVINIEATLRAIIGAIQDAELVCGREVVSCCVGIGGSHIDGFNSRGVVTVAGKNRETREIGPEDRRRVLQLAREVKITMDRQVLEAIPQSYIVDNQKGIRNPLNMLGVRLEAEVHIVTCSSTSAQNLVRCVNRAGFQVDELILQSLAAGRSVLTEEEKDMGVALVDLGGGSTELLVYSDGSPYSTSNIPAGSELVTRDISLVKSISFENAEKVKIEAGCCWRDLLEGDDIIVPGIGGRPTVPISREQLLEIINPRVEEIYRMVKVKLDKLVLSRPLGAGIVLTGGGAMLPGAAELASHIFNMPVRVGNPLPVQGLSEEFYTPVYATAIGLALERNDRENGAEERGGDLGGGKGGSRWGIGKLFDWLKDFF
jgi:cell division protein FtsA